VKRHASNLRSADQVTHAFDAYARPEIGTMSICDVRRSHINKMLDKVEDQAGPVMADRTLAHVRKAFNWHAARDDDFSSPIVRGMARTRPKERARKRVLADDEIRDIWKALETAKVPSCYPPFVKSLLLCATRRNESAYMNSTELEDGLWTIPGERYKTKLDHCIPLTAQARALIGDKPDGFKGNAWFVFSTTGGRKGFSGFSKAKRELDTTIANIRKAEGREKMPPWTLHDLRRTARSLMSRAKVPTDHAERALGHVIGGVRETYDRYEYVDEKRAAFKALAGLVHLILNPADNVVPLRQAD
jgi:integrase